MVYYKIGLKLSYGKWMQGISFFLYGDIISERLPSAGFLCYAGMRREPRIACPVHHASLLAAWCAVTSV